jgi:RNA polymerase sigma factor (sigma-70 family)
VAIPGDPVPTQNAHSLFASHLPLIEAVVAVIARRHHLSPEDADDFGSVVKLKLLESECAVLRKFANRSSVRTYLTVVIQRMFLDHRIRAWGKWRPSAGARRAGPVAILLERLTTRDGHSFENACSIMQVTHQVKWERRQLEELYARLPARVRRQMVSDAALETLADPGDLERDAIVDELGTRHRRIGEYLGRLVEDLPPEDRLVLRLKFAEGLTLAAVARATGLPQRLLYPKMDRLLRDLRLRLEQCGFTGADVLHWLDNQQMVSGVFEPGTVNAEPGPSVSEDRPESRRVSDRG